MENQKHNNRIKKMALFLKKLQDNTKSPRNVGIFKEIGKEVGIGTLGTLRPLLVNMKLISITKNINGEKVITWISNDTNIQLACNVSDQFSAILKSYGKTGVKVAVKLEETPLIENLKKIDALIVKGTRSDKEFRVHMFIQFLYEKVRDLMLSESNLDLESRLKQYSLESEIIDVLVAGKYLDRERHKGESVLLWIGSEPTDEMAKEISYVLGMFMTIQHIRKSFSVPIKDKSFDLDEVKVINVLKEKGKQFCEIAKLVERSESEVKKMFYNYIINTNS